MSCVLNKDVCNMAIYQHGLNDRIRRHYPQLSDMEYLIHTNDDYPGAQKTCLYRSKHAGGYHMDTRVVFETVNGTCRPNFTLSNM